MKHSHVITCVDCTQQIDLKNSSKEKINKFGWYMLDSLTWASIGVDKGILCKKCVSERLFKAHLAPIPMNDVYLK